MLLNCIGLNIYLNKAIFYPLIQIRTFCLTNGVNRYFKYFKAE